MTMVDHNQRYYLSGDEVPKQLTPQTHTEPNLVTNPTGKGMSGLLAKMITNSMPSSGEEAITSAVSGEMLARERQRCLLQACRERLLPSHRV